MKLVAIIIWKFFQFFNFLWCPINKMWCWWFVRWCLQLTTPFNRWCDYGAYLSRSVRAIPITEYIRNRNDFLNNFYRNAKAANKRHGNWWNIDGHASPHDNRFSDSFKLCITHCDTTYTKHTPTNTRRIKNGVQITNGDLTRDNLTFSFQLNGRLIQSTKCTPIRQRSQWRAKEHSE